MNLDELKLQVEKDLKVDDEHLDTESLKNQEEEFKKTYKNSRPTASDAEINAAWEQIRGSVEKYLIDTYFEMTSDGQKITRRQLNDRVRDDKENGVFAQFFDTEGVDPLVTGN